MRKLNFKGEKLATEKLRLSKLYSWEKELMERGYRYIAGTDEAGRGPIAGPVVAASVILEPDTYLEGLNDSKKFHLKKEKNYLMK